MREKISQQRLLMPAPSEHQRARQLRAISAVLDANPHFAELVHRDLTANVSAAHGRSGLSADQVLRIMLLQRVTRFGFDELAFAVNDSETYWHFCRLGTRARVAKSTLHANVRRIRAETLELLNRLVVEEALAKKIERVDRVRTDATITQTNIHAPTDSSLLWDAVRVLVRAMEKASRLVGVKFDDLRRDAKIADITISTATSGESRRPHYKTLVGIAERVVSDAERIAAEIGTAKKHAKRLSKIATTIGAVAPLARRVIDQTKRRVFDEKKVPSAEKVVSIFEPHSDVVTKNRFEVLFGHKVTLTTGAAGIVLDCVVDRGSPADLTLAVRSVTRLKAAYRRTPRAIVFDGSYASRANLDAIKAEGVKDVAFTKAAHRGIKVADMVRDPATYLSLRHFRAAIEGNISYLKRVVGLRRCLWRGLPGFHAYVWGGVLAANLLTLTRHQLR